MTHWLHFAYVQLVSVKVLLTEVRERLAVFRVIDMTDWLCFCVLLVLLPKVHVRLAIIRVIDMTDLVCFCLQLLCCLKYMKDWLFFM